MFINGFKEILDRYDLFIVDIWGVLYSEGDEGAFPCVLPLLREIRDAGKKLVFLSNAPRLMDHVKSSIEKLGISEDMYSRIHSSGMETRLLADSGEFSNFGKKCFLLGTSRGLLEGIESIEIVDSLEKADFVMLSSLDVRDNMDFYADFLKQLKEHNLPVLCPNPDTFVTTGNGTKLYCQGQLAEMYEAAGGKVRQIGKPFNEVYNRIFSWFPNVNKKRVIAVGDNLLTDIKGGNNSGIDSVLIANGVYANLVHDANGELVDERLQELYSVCKAKPTYVAEWFGI